MECTGVYATLADRILRFVLTAFFLIGGSINLAGPLAVLSEYQSWGYPTWFHWLTGFLELATACLLIPKTTQLYAVVLGSCVMIGAAVTLAVHQSWVRTALPVFIFVLLASLFRTALSARSR
ncbi:DoxX family protein [Sphingobium lactosutens]|jgi:hypothetical protein|uniref:DoxX family protein n=1 Tax=Sphingobium lactosutens DS20 TaxID=1331060 RepID=T0HVL1_9SPHN|nr:DoxX family protein [Sphingobium lactosutens]EQB17167.1 hypothetical protein RLDS_04235 [Sphingobium lactosutens DS20]